MKKHLCNLFLCLVVLISFTSCLNRKTALSGCYSITNDFYLSGTRVTYYENGRKVRDVALNDDGQEYLSIYYNDRGDVISVKENTLYWPPKDEHILYERERVSPIN